MVHPWVLHNDELRRADEPLLAAGQIGVLSGWGVFSTVRVARGILFEFPRHYARMKRDAALMHVPFPDDEQALERALLRVVHANGRLDCTLRVAIMRNKGGLWQAPSIERNYDLIALTADLHNWGRSVRLAIAPHGRYAQSKFAAAKILSWASNLTLYEEAHERGFDEVILLNERGEVSECTSANIFLVCGNTVFTPALRSGCLPGVTREVILQCIHVPGIEVREKDILPAELETADEVFITSTTRDLLPVVEIEGMHIQHRSNVRERLEDAFGRYIDEYLAARAPALQV
ncbi:MAG TPA: aminotransferase class IV [Bryobacteraceae bacterium]|nr:aminotransferase class IV [Bryobacteraceae bacterium]